MRKIPVRSFADSASKGRVKSFFRVVAVVSYSLFLISHLSSCGYTLQTKAQLPFEEIAVGTIANKTFEPKVEDRFNRVLAETFAEYGYRVTPTAHHILDGEITGFELIPRSEQNLTATQYEVIIKASFRLTDRENGKTTPFIAGSPFITYFSSEGRLETVIARKELATVSALKNLSQELVRQISYKTPQYYAYMLFIEDDIKDLDSLALLLQSPEDPLSRYLYGRFAPATRRLLADYNKSKRAADELKKTLVNELNLVIQGIPLYDEERFGQVALSDETRHLISQKPSGVNLLRLNRILLDEAYPRQLAGMQENRNMDAAKP
jgi:hypothetical protein